MIWKKEKPKKKKSLKNSSNGLIYLSKQILYGDTRTLGYSDKHRYRVFKTGYNIILFIDACVCLINCLNNNLLDKMAEREEEWVLF